MKSRWAQSVGIVALMVFMLLVTAANLMQVKQVSDFAKVISEVGLSEGQIEAQEPEVTIEQKEVRVAFGGDMMYDRNIRLQANKIGYEQILAGVSERLNEFDLVVANLEGPITSSSSVSVGSTPDSPNNFSFTFDPQTVTSLSQANIKVVNLGNNHIRNFGGRGVLETLAHLDGAGIKYFGQGVNGDVATGLIVEVDWLKLGLINYNQFGGDFEEALAEIDRLKPESDLVVAMTHWGEEYKTSPTAQVREQAHQMIEAGAEVIIGTHPHVIAEKEEYLEKTIYYSLGNFVFDQYFSAETKEGLVVEMRVSPEKEVSFTDHKVVMDTNGQTKWSEEQVQ